MLDLVVTFVPVLTVANELVFVIASIEDDLASPKTGLLVFLEHVLVNSPVVEGTGNGHGRCERAVGFEHNRHLLGSLSDSLRSGGLSGSLRSGGLSGSLRSGLLSSRLGCSNFLFDGRLCSNGLKAIENGGAGLVHLDIMDGHFVPNISFGPGISACVGKGTKLPLDCHLMIENPENYVGEFAKAGASIISVHAETTNHLDRLLHQIAELGVKPAVAINPATPLESIKYVLDIVDMVLVMSVNPGFGGQSLIPYCLDKIRELRAMKPELNIQIDGGVKLDNILACKEAGANVFVVGSAIFGKSDPEAVCREFVVKVGAYQVDERR